MIRPYQNTDKEAIVKLFKLNVPSYFHPTEEKNLHEYLQGYIEEYFVIEEAAQIIGAGGINYEPDKISATLSWDIINPAHHGKGFGRKLTQHRINLIKQNPLMEHIIVRTSQHTYRFYAKFGFELLRTEKNYWAEGLDYYEMRLALR